MTVGKDCKLTIQDSVVKVRYMPFPEEVEGIHGFVQQRRKGSYTIIIDANADTDLQRHTIGHELGHILLHHFDRPAEQIEQMEAQAEQFADDFARIFDVL